MRVALALITEISDRDVAVRVTGASGTIKSLKSKAALK
jgi:RNase P/RNase MRP subunit POP5